MKKLDDFIQEECEKLKFENYQQFLHYHPAYTPQFMQLMRRAAESYADYKIDLFSRSQSE